MESFILNVYLNKQALENGKPVFCRVLDNFKLRDLNAYMLSDSMRFLFGNDCIVEMKSIPYGEK